MIRKPIPTAWQILMNSRWSAMSHIQVSSWNSVLCRAMVQRTLGASLDEQRTIADEVLGDVGDLLEAVGHCDWIDWGKVQNWKDRMIQSSTEREKAEGVDWEEKRMIWTVFLLYGEIGELALLETGDSVLPLPGRWGALRRHPSCLPTSPPPAPTDWRLSHHQRPSFLVSPFVFDIAKLLCMGFRFRLNRFFTTCPISCSRQLRRLSPSLAFSLRWRKSIQGIYTNWVEILCASGIASV